MIFLTFSVILLDILHTHARTHARTQNKSIKIRLSKN